MGADVPPILGPRDRIETFLQVRALFLGPPGRNGFGRIEIRLEGLTLSIAKKGDGKGFLTLWTNSGGDRGIQLSVWTFAFDAVSPRAKADFGWKEIGFTRKPFEVVEVFQLEFEDRDSVPKVELPGVHIRGMGDDDFKDGHDPLLFIEQAHIRDKFSDRRLDETGDGGLKGTPLVFLAAAVAGLFQPDPGSFVEKAANGLRQKLLAHQVEQGFAGQTRGRLGVGEMVFSNVSLFRNERHAAARALASAIETGGNL